MKITNSLSLLFIVVIVFISVQHVEAVVQCERFETLVQNTVYGNSTNYPPGTAVTSNTYLQFFRNKDPSVIQYLQMRIVPSFAAFGTSGNAAQLERIDIQFSFRGVQVKYVSFDFLDTGNVQNLRVNKDRLYKGSMVTMGGVVAPNVAFKPSSTRRFQRNIGELFAVNNQVISDLWIGGDDLTIDNVCWDTAYHEPPVIPIASNRFFSSSNDAALKTPAVAFIVMSALIALIASLF